MKALTGVFGSTVVKYSSSTLYPNSTPSTTGAISTVTFTVAFTVLSALAVAVTVNVFADSSAATVNVPSSATFVFALALP